MKKRFAFTLLEIILSLPLIFLLFSFLIATLLSSHQHQQKLQKKEREVLQNHYFQKGLQKKLSRVIKQKEISPDYLKSDEVFFSFNNGISRQKKLSGNLFAKLHLDKNSLTLSLYQKEKKTLKKIREDELLNHVEKVHFEYLFEKKKLETKSHPCPYELIHQNLDSSSAWVALKCKVWFINESQKEFFFSLPRGGS